MAIRVFSSVARRGPLVSRPWTALPPPVAIGSNLTSAYRFHGDEGDRSKPLQVTFTLPDGEEKEVTAYEGQNLLDVCAEHHLPMEGACAGSCACSTCHVYLEDEAVDLFQEPSDEENDMIDMAFFPEATSRLGCQLKLIKSKHNGLKVRMPKATRNMYVDGAKVVPH
ncbi:electron transfer protein [Angomonas deanei]|nr:electron transfer protein [Angomonas deanei]|eukprot:EPY31082.1 electron transfer protein [Angomonas deanei]